MQDKLERLGKKLTNWTDPPAPLLPWKETVVSMITKLGPFIPYLRT